MDDSAAASRHCRCGRESTSRRRTERNRCNAGISFSSPSPRAPMIFEDRFPSGEFAFQSIWIYISAPADRQVGRAIFRYGTVHPGISNTAPNSRHVTKGPKATKSGNYCFRKNGMELSLRSLLKSLCRTPPSKEEAPAITCTSIRPQSAKIEVSQYA